MASSADIVFLIDATASMNPVIQGLKNNLKTFFKEITTPSGQNAAPIRDWRAKVVAFRDATADKVWFEDMAFTDDVSTLENALDNVNDTGGGDMPESLLDAIYTIAQMPETGAQGSPEADKWRYVYSTARFVIAITDAAYKDPMTATAPVNCAGMGVDEVITAVENAKIRLVLIHPKTTGDDHGNNIDITGDYEALTNARNAMDMPTVDGSGNEIPLNEFAQSEKFTDLLALLGRTVTRVSTPAAVPAAPESSTLTIN